MSSRFRQRMVASSAVAAIGLAVPASAQDATAPAPAPPTALANTSDEPGPQDEIVVTATRRRTSVIDVPYNISAYGGDLLRNQRVYDVGDLARVVPGLSYVDMGPGGSRSASAVLIIRGLNATPLEGRLAGLAQPPVATYLGDTPLNAYFHLQDIQRVEVLRGPQGTLFGAGALGGALRLIPNLPELGNFSGRVEVSGGLVSRSSKTDYRIEAILNVPLTGKAAFRVSVGKQHQAGFIDALGLYARSGDGGPLSPVIHSIPGDLSSPPVVVTRRDVNDADTFYGRAALRYEPSSTLKGTLAFNWSTVRAKSAQTDNPYWRGGAYVPPAPPAPGINLPATGDYQQAWNALEPSRRDNWLASLDLEADFGFATLTSNSSYYETRGETFRDTTGSLDYLGGGAYAPYYVGSPRYPGFIMSGSYPDRDHAFTQELRLVSSAGGLIDWTVGAFYTRQKGSFVWDERAPGMAAWKAFSGASLPDGFVRDEVEFELTRATEFSEVAGYGELGINPSSRWNITAGVRVFSQRSRIDQNFFSNVYPGFHFAEGAVSTENLTRAAFKLSTNYRYAPDQRVYAVFSQGFRRGGANAFATAGPFAEPRSLVSYRPDTVDNYEIGLKGRLLGFNYTAALFRENIHNIQVDTQTPTNTWPVVVNGSSARSQGFEFEASGQLSRNLSLLVGYAYADAKLTESFKAPTAVCCIAGTKGDQLPGSPRHTATITLTYSVPLADKLKLDLAGTALYRSSVATGLTGFDDVRLSGYALVNVSAKIVRAPWDLTLFADNVTNRRVEQGLLRPERAGNLYQNRNINRPRVVGIRLGYAW